MPGQEIKITATGGGEFNCYIAVPTTSNGPAVIIMASIFGVDADVRGNVDDLAARGFVAAAPDLFWRGDAGPMPRTENGMQRARERAKDRDALIEKGVQDLADVIAALDSYPQFNGKTAVVGLCYGGPYALLGPARLGCAAGIAFHGTRVENYLAELSKVQVPLSLHWGDQDHAAPPETLQAIQAATRDMNNVDITVYPGVAHGYTAPSSSSAWNENAATRSWNRALDILNNLRDTAAA